VVLWVVRVGCACNCTDETYPLLIALGCWVDWACDVVVIGPGAGAAKGHYKKIGKGVYRPPESSSSCEDLDLIRMMVVFVAVSTLPKTKRDSQGGYRARGGYRRQCKRTMRLIVVGQLAQGGMLAGNERKKRRAVASTRSMLSAQHSGPGCADHQYQWRECSSSSSRGAVRSDAIYLR